MTWDLLFSSTVHLFRYLWKCEVDLEGNIQIAQLVLATDHCMHPCEATSDIYLTMYRIDQRTSPVRIARIVVGFDSASKRTGLIRCDVIMAFHSNTFFISL